VRSRLAGLSGVERFTAKVVGDATKQSLRLLVGRTGDAATMFCGTLGGSFAVLKLSLNAEYRSPNGLDNIDVALSRDEVEVAVGGTNTTLDCIGSIEYIAIAQDYLDNI